MKQSKLLLLFALCIFIFAFGPVGCFGPTYPKGRIEESLIDLCKREYGVDVEVRVVGKTIGVYIPISELVDSGLSISQQALRKVDDVAMSVSRVALSTDADFNFYVVVAQDPAMPELELVIIRYVEDIKRFLVTDISRSEYFERMITEFKFTPQVRKEKLLRERFKSIGVEIPEKVISDYFKSGYIETISDIGYLNGNFFLKDLGMGEFLAKQVEERIRRDFSRIDFLTVFKLNMVEGTFKEDVFNLRLGIDSKREPVENPDFYRFRILKHVCTVISKVINGYKFKDYSHVNVFSDGEKTIFTKEDMDNLKRGRIKPEDII